MYHTPTPLVLPATKMSGQDLTTSHPVIITPRSFESAEPFWLPVFGVSTHKWRTALELKALFCFFEMV
jgi:hypothetical protein